MLTARVQLDANRDVNPTDGGTMLAAFGGIGIVGLIVAALVVIVIVYFVRRA
jgi:hypothetical protein